MICKSISESAVQRRFLLFVGCTILLLPVLAPTQTLIQNARIIDGTGAAEYAASVRIEGSRIKEIGDLEPLPGEIVVNAGGLVLAPGFIDTHSHHDRDLLENRSALPTVSQGITTIVRGQDGENSYTSDEYISLTEFKARIAQSPVAVNVASFAAHNSIRGEVLGVDSAREATDDEIGEMKDLLLADLEAGALGLATGLEYEPGMHASTDEVVALAKIAAAAGGRYISHIRSEEAGFWDAIDEAILIGQEANIPVHISHIKLATKYLWNNMDRLLGALNWARVDGVDLSADIYPYNYWQSTVTVLFAERDFDNRATAEYVLDSYVPADKLIIARFEADPSIIGKTITEIAAMWDVDPATALMRVTSLGDRYNRELGRSTETVIAESMRRDEVASLMSWPHTNIGSDGYMGGAHPRGAGAFPRVLAHYVREERTLDLVTAVHKMTGLSAHNMGISDRGTIKPGNFADLVLFDPDAVQDHATIANPTKIATGIEQVWVNGVTVFRDGAVTGELPGAIVSRYPVPEIRLPQTVTDKTMKSTIDAWLRSLNNHNLFNGTVLMAQDGDVLFSKSYGVRDPQHELELGRNSQFNVASVSKQFTAMSIMMLANQGRLDYDDPVTRYIPEWDYGGVTIRNMMNHTSGLPDYISLAKLHWDPSTLLTNGVMIGLLRDHAPELYFKPGTKYEYSNTAYVALAEIVERVAELSFADFLRINIFEPLQMEHTATFNLLTDERVLEQRVLGIDGFILQDLTNLDAVLGDGGMYTSTEDLLKWDQALYSSKLLPQEELQRAFTSDEFPDGTPIGYGFGWYVRGNDIVEHKGWWYGFDAFIRRDMANRTLLVVMNSGSNHTTIYDVFDELSIALDAWATATEN